MKSKGMPDTEHLPWSYEQEMGPSPFTPSLVRELQRIVFMLMSTPCFADSLLWFAFLYTFFKTANIEAVKSQISLVFSQLRIQ